MATPFLVLKTLTGFDFQFTKVWRHFYELVLSRITMLNRNWIELASWVLICPNTSVYSYIDGNSKKVKIAQVILTFFCFCEIDLNLDRFTKVSSHFCELKVKPSKVFQN
jgi:hypothetical protein